MNLNHQPDPGLVSTAIVPRQHRVKRKVLIGTGSTQDALFGRGVPQRHVFEYCEGHDVRKKVYGTLGVALLLPYSKDICCFESLFDFCSFHCLVFAYSCAVARIPYNPDYELRRRSASKEQSCA